MHACLLVRSSNEFGITKFTHGTKIFPVRPCLSVLVFLNDPIMKQSKWDDEGEMQQISFTFCTGMVFKKGSLVMTCNNYNFPLWFLKLCSTKYAYIF